MENEIRPKKLPHSRGFMKIWLFLHSTHGKVRCLWLEFGWNKQETIASPFSFLPTLLPCESSISSRNGRRMMLYTLGGVKGLPRRSQRGAGDPLPLSPGVSTASTAVLGLCVPVATQLCSALQQVSVGPGKVHGLSLQRGNRTIKR